eukprot:m.301690 g.301690  ORF g.301690 m.301690 type:complete len:300 (+) comp22997_c0_seq6:538-1437(+)
MDEWDDIQASSVAALQVVQACHQRLYEDVERALAESLQSHIAALEQWLLAPAPLPEHPGLLDDTFISSLSAPLAKMCLEHNQGLRSMWSIAQAASADTPPMATSEPTSKSGASTALARLKHGRRHKQAKPELVRLLDQMTPTAVQAVAADEGYDVSVRQLQRWAAEEKADAPEEGARPGPKPCRDFEEAVLSHLVSVEIFRTWGGAKRYSVQTAMFSNSSIRIALMAVQKLEPFASMAEVSRLRFSDEYILAFKKRHLLRRKRVTQSRGRGEPPLSEVHSIMAGIEADIDQEQHPPALC